MSIGTARVTDHKGQSVLLVNYHYVRGRDQYPYPGVYPIEREEFEEQLTWLQQRFHMASPEEVEAFCHGEGALPKRSVFLTFDDGLVDHIEIARDVLDPRGIRAAFFVCSQPVMEQKAIMVHKVHWLRAMTEPENFAKEFAGMLPARWATLARQKATAKEALETYVYDTPQNARLKYLINFQLPTDVVESITSEMLSRREVPEEEFCGQLYMNETQLLELVQAGHIVGSHGHTHTPFTRLSENGLNLEIETNLGCLESITGVRPRWVSYPYGSPWAIPDDAREFCHKFEFCLGLTLNRDWNDGTQSPWALNRVNTNDVAGIIGKAEIASKSA